MDVKGYWTFNEVKINYYMLIKYVLWIDNRTTLSWKSLLGKFEKGKTCHSNASIFESYIDLETCVVVLFLRKFCGFNTMQRSKNQLKTQISGLEGLAYILVDIKITQIVSNSCMLSRTFCLKYKDSLLVSINLPFQVHFQWVIHGESFLTYSPQASFSG